jgi:hypothetical protein
VSGSQYRPQTYCFGSRADARNTQRDKLRIDGGSLSRSSATRDASRMFTKYNLPFGAKR